MKYKIDESSQNTKYMQLYLELREDIVNEVYRYGEKLPSKRLLAEETGTSVITVEHVYNILMDEGYIEAKERSGYFVIYRSGDVYSVAPPKNLPLSAPVYHKQAEEFPFSVFAKTMRKVITDYGEELLVKSPNFGRSELREAIAAYLVRSCGISVLSEQIVIGAGAEYLYGLIVQFLEEKHYALENPSYEKIRQVYEANGVQCDMLALTRNGISTDELAKTKAKVLHVTPFHSFPSSITASASKRQEYLRWAKERNGMIVEDNYDSELTISKKHEDTLFSLEPNKTVIYLNTFSKTIAPSMRMGYMILPREKIGEFYEKMGFYSCTVPTFEQLVLAEFINRGDFERHINRVRRSRRRMQNLS